MYVVEFPPEEEDTLEPVTQQNQEETRLANELQVGLNLKKRKHVLAICNSPEELGTEVVDAKRMKATPFEYDKFSSLSIPLVNYDKAEEAGQVMPPPSP